MVRMLAIISAFVQQVLLTGQFKVSALPSKTYQELLTAAEQLVKEPIVLINSLVALAKRLPGRLIVDDTSNSKYSRLRGLSRKLFIPSTGGYGNGYRVLLFLWESGGIRFPVAFALWHKESAPLTELTLEGLSRLRNEAELKPLLILGDGAFGTEEIVKRVTDYGWPCIFRLKNNRILSGKKIKQLIPRGYGEAGAKLDNGVKVKVVRRKNHFLQCNRMSWNMGKIRSDYAKRWQIEETFRILKSCLHLSGCQQHTVSRQVLYVLLCCVALACLEMYPDLSPYAARNASISGELDPEKLLNTTLFAA
jgi:Transposase DDE domain